MAGDDTERTTARTDGRRGSDFLDLSLSGGNARPVREQVTDVLRRAILELQIKPGRRLVERELMERLNVSRATVREALRELTSEGLVEVVPNRGAVVAAPTVEEASDLYEARAAVEGLLVRLFTERAARSQMIKLEAAMEAFAEATVEYSDDPVTMLQIKDEFIQVIFTGAGSPVIQRLAEGLRGRVRLLRVKAISAGYPTSASELREIVAAVRSGDGDEAARLYSRHILGSKSRAFTALRDTEEESG
ncbi:GntR family transcriptional regulator [Actinomadura rugatobispora]|uniref:GntR family transcriptional regulator n=1 Tax=Actinomadura rugatobispora TaxID=1994 RepID=A0ABW1A8S3_9ACTN|nr:GntR family transcriptional regulator [Actinomadura rugatobispora]